MIIIIVYVIIENDCVVSFYLNQHAHTAGANNNNEKEKRTFWNHRNANVILQQCVYNLDCQLGLPSHHLIHLVKWNFLADDIFLEWERKRNDWYKPRCFFFLCRNKIHVPTKHGLPFWGNTTRQSIIEGGNAVALILLLMAPLLKTLSLERKKKTKPGSEWIEGP